MVFKMVKEEWWTQDKEKKNIRKARDFLSSDHFHIKQKDLLLGGGPICSGGILPFSKGVPCTVFRQAATLVTEG